MRKRPRSWWRRRAQRAADRAERACERAAKAQAIVDRLARLGWFRCQRELAGAPEVAPMMEACAGARAGNSEIPVSVSRHYLVADGQVPRVAKLPPVAMGQIARSPSIVRLCSSA